MIRSAERITAGLGLAGFVLGVLLQATALMWVGLGFVVLSLVAELVLWTRDTGRPDARRRR